MKNFHICLDALKDNFDYFQYAQSGILLHLSNFAFKFIQFMKDRGKMGKNEWGWKFSYCKCDCISSMNVWEFSILKNLTSGNFNDFLLCKWFENDKQKFGESNLWRVKPFFKFIKVSCSSSFPFLQCKVILDVVLF
jgi:hypothetical protein